MTFGKLTFKIEWIIRLQYLLRSSRSQVAGHMHVISYSSFTFATDHHAYLETS